MYETASLYNGQIKSHPSGDLAAIADFGAHKTKGYFRSKANHHQIYFRDELKRHYRDDELSRCDLNNIQTLSRFY